MINSHVDFPKSFFKMNVGSKTDYILKVRVYKILKPIREIEENVQ